MSLVSTQSLLLHRDLFRPTRGVGFIRSLHVVPFSGSALLFPGCQLSLTSKRTNPHSTALIFDLMRKPSACSSVFMFWLNFSDSRSDSRLTSLPLGYYICARIPIFLIFHFASTSITPNPYPIPCSLATALCSSLSTSLVLVDSTLPCFGYAWDSCGICVETWCLRFDTSTSDQHKFTLQLSLTFIKLDHSQFLLRSFVVGLTITFTFPWYPIFSYCLCLPHLHARVLLLQ